MKPKTLLVPVSEECCYLINKFQVSFELSHKMTTLIISLRSKQLASLEVIDGLISSPYSFASLETIS